MRRKKIKVAIYFLALAMAAVLVGFLAGTYYKAHVEDGLCEDVSTNSAVVSYNLFSGERVYTVTVGEGERFTVWYDLVSYSGDLDILVTRDGERVSAFSDVETCEFSEIWDVPGTYQVAVKAYLHRGGYSLFWVKTEP